MIPRHSFVLVVALGGCLAPLEIPKVTAPEHAPAELARVEALADAPVEALPTEVRLHEVARHWFAGWQVGAPDRDVAVIAFVTVQIVTPDGTVLIDLPHPKHLDGRLTGVKPSVYDDAAFEAALQAAEEAKAIVLTHEHYDHAAAFALERMAPVRTRSLVLNARQKASRVLQKNAEFTDAMLEGVRTVPYDAPHVLAPGIVLVPAPGHTPGTQLVYVRTAAGQRYLFVGDIAWHASNYEVPRGKPRLVHFLLEENGEAMAHQLRWLHEVMRAEPGLILVTAHDGEQHDRLVTEGRILRGLAERTAE